VALASPRARQIFFVMLKSDVEALSMNFKE
jgi:hypothetical protein